ncbi:hypothetical protein CIG75_09340 [Tumebacillus algifaecis]|uniref:Uncharacterized protein n=1 Tax=Tumebacillus algifaecis TaxID=1214604 RepID=A0A223D103_9BACL|nr:hypothetical protein [Tumebacillus algifaecis]ASS75165.1 hypothetical protein CIG75_09340 [Tumebacillus algifaecis]
MEQRRQQTYEERFLRAYERLEKPLFKLILLGFALILIGQMALSTAAGRQFLSATDRMEGQRANGVMPAAATEKSTANITIRSVEADAPLSKVWVKVNGVPSAAFQDEEVTVSVHQGDVVTVDTSELPGVYRFEVDHDNPGISYPVPGMLVEAMEGQLAEVGPIHFMK